MKKIKKVLVTGGTGFIGSSLVKALIKRDYEVRVFDNNSRGAIRRLEEVRDQFEFVGGDIRNADDVLKACTGMDSIIHLAFINGTEFFYSIPDQVLDVGVRGILNVIDSCIKLGIKDLMVASSSEVYQSPSIIPTPENIPMIIPDPLNPRYSYAGGKIITELMAINFGRKYLDRVTIFRPHNVYGPDMGWEHVIPQFVLRMKELTEKNPKKTIDFPIQGSGKETRSFIYIDDFVDGVMKVFEQGKHLEIYHIGTDEEVQIAKIAKKLAEQFNQKINIITGKAATGSTSRRCPDITKLRKLGFKPAISLDQGLQKTQQWYIDNHHLKSNILAMPNNEQKNQYKSTTVVEKCQVCGNPDLTPILFLGYMPPVNKMPNIGDTLIEQPSYPAQVLYCSKCYLVQLGLIVDPEILFPKEYPYTSSTTKVLRENFTELYKESTKIIDLKESDLVIDIGSNDGNLLSNFKDHCQVLGVTPEDIGKLAIEKGIPTILDYFNKEVVDKVQKDYGKAKLITATNVFAHIQDINQIVKLISDLLKTDGVFISESHYLLPLITGLQYDTVYHEHLRYYSLHSLKNLLERHGLEIFYAKRIPTHGGSIRVYAAQKGLYPIDKKVKDLLIAERKVVTDKKSLLNFRDRVVMSKLNLYNLLLGIKKRNKKIYGISAPSRASTLINYVGLDESIIDCIVEIKGSYKIGKYVPGTLIPVLEESKLYKDQPEYALLFSWHIAKELMPKLKSLGFKGDFIIPLPNPTIIKNKDIK